MSGLTCLTSSPMVTSRLPTGPSVARRRAVRTVLLSQASLRGQLLRLRARRRRPDRRADPAGGRAWPGAAAIRTSGRSRRAWRHVLALVTRRSTRTIRTAPRHLTGSASSGASPGSTAHTPWNRRQRPRPGHRTQHRHRPLRHPHLRRPHRRGSPFPATAATASLIRQTGLLEPFADQRDLDGGDHNCLFCASEPASRRRRARANIRQGGCG
jgi:hypothetical protein